MKRFLACAVIGVLCAFTGSAAASTFHPGAPGIGDPYFPLAGNGGYDVGHYSLDVSYDPATAHLDGVATIEATATENLSSFNLDFHGLNVHSITVDWWNATWTRDGDELTVTPKRGLKSGRPFTVVVHYEGEPGIIDAALGPGGWFPTDDGALVIGEPDVAAAWFPVNDHPADKASYTIEVTRPGRPRGRLQRQPAAQEDEGRQHDVRVADEGADGLLPGDRDDRQVPHHLLQQGRAALLRRDRSGALRRRRDAHERDAAGDLGPGGFVVQAPDAHDRRAGGWRDAVVLGHARHRAELGLRVRRGAHGRTATTGRRCPT